MSPLRARLALALALLVAAGLSAPPASAQRLEVDRGVRVAGLWCFPLEGEPGRFLYLPARARLATDDRGRPQFSFVRYVEPAAAPAADGEGAGASDASTIRRAGGGGVLHFLVEYHTPTEQLQRAEAELERMFGEGGERQLVNPGDDEEEVEIVLAAPVIFQHGRYNLVSSVVGESGGERHLLATGRAPVLEGNRLALSFDLDPTRAKLLLESFRMATPDVSLAFDLTFSGLADAYDARMVVDWSQVKESLGARAGGTVYFVSADVEHQVDELIRNGAITLQTAGQDAASEALLTHVYDRVVGLLFEPVEPERVPEEHAGGLMDALGALVGSDGALGSRNTTGFGAYVGFQYKHMRSEGESVLDFDHRATVERHHLLAFNIGDLHRRHGDDPDYFRTVSLEDPAFQQRLIHVSVDGALLPEFDRLVDSVTVTLRKTHGNGEVTLRELVVNRQAVEEAVEEAGGELVLAYGWNGDSDRMAWLEYEYRTRWSFQGGGSHQTPWRRTDAALIDLYAPYHRRTVEVVDAGAPLAELGVRAVVVQVLYDFFGQRRREQIVVRPDRPSEQPPRVEITLPRDQFDYDYDLTWMLDGGGRESARGRDGSGLIFLDPPPAAAGDS